MKAIVVKSFGGPEVMEYTEYRDPTPRGDQILAETRMIGVNYADTYQTENTYLVQSLPPVIPGIEASFYIDGKLFVGNTASGSYAEKVIVNKDRIFEVPDGVSEEEALASVVQGTTAYAIVNDLCDIKPDDLVLINGASSGTGVFLIQLCKLLGAKVIAVTADGEKLEFVKTLDVDFACKNDLSEIKKLIKSIGKKPKFILESYGGTQFMDYYNMLDVGGHICSYGASSREGLPNINVRDLIKDTRLVSGFWGTKVFQDTDKLKSVINSLFDLIKNKKIKVVLGDTMSLKDAKLMHEKIRSRNTVGKLILINNLGNKSDS